MLGVPHVDGPGECVTVIDEYHLTSVFQGHVIVQAILSYTYMDFDSRGIERLDSTLTLFTRNELAPVIYRYL